MNPCNVGLFVRIPSVEVIGFSDDPVERGFANSRAAALGGRLSDDELLRLTDAVHRHGCRS